MIHRDSKKAIHDAKKKKFSDLYNWLNTKEGEKCVYKLINQRDI